MAKKTTSKSRQKSDYSRHLLAIPEKPQSPRFIRVINSPAFLWLLSLIILVFGSAYFTTYRQCVSDAKTIDDNYEHVSLELKARRAAFIDRAKNATTMAEFLKVVRTDRTHDNSKFRDMTVRQVYMQYLATKARIDLSRIPEHPDAFKKEDGYIRFSNLFNGWIFAEPTEEDLPALKAYLPNYAVHQFLLAVTDQIVVVSQCDFLRTAALMLGYEPQIARAYAIDDFFERFLMRRAEKIPD